MSLDEILPQKLKDDLDKEAETDTFTIKLTEDELLNVSQVIYLLLVDKVITVDVISEENQEHLRLARNKMQKQLDFPDMKF